MQSVFSKIPLFLLALALGCGLFIPSHSYAQSLSNKQKLVITPEREFYQLDSNYIIELNSIQFFKTNGDSSKIRFNFNPKNGKLIIKSEDTLLMVYRKLPDIFSKKIYKRSENIIEIAMVKDPFAFDPLRDGGLNANSSGLKTDGNLSRGISVGNKQDLVLNSNFNLRLGGKIADDVNLSGVISEDNNPIQPEGNTQQLQDFDKIFIQLNKDSNNLIMGDFEMRAPGGYFMNYYKKSRGMHFDFKKTYGNYQTFSNIDAAISRGRFARNTIQGIEGNQGPYRLNGINGETFIIIISGTEVVYLDGKRMTRGESNDYTINYNSGEITFMPSHMITKFSRIVAEFQYSDRNYQRTVYKLGAGVQKNKTTFAVNYFSEQDNKNRSFQLSLDGFDSSKNKSARQILADAGDNQDSASIRRVKRITPFDNTKLLYRKIDTLGFSPVYKFTQDPNSDTAFYELQFSLVGTNKGNYRQKISTTNGRVYEWVAPAGNIPQGDYEPIEILITPKRYQMLTVGISQKSGNTETFLEAVYSQNNFNTISKLDKNNDDGYGLVTGIKHSSSVSKNITLAHQFKTEFVTNNFKFLERYRPVEFERNWNRQINYPATNTLRLPQILAVYDVTFDFKKRIKLSYKSAINHRSKDYSGLNNMATLAFKYKNTQFQTAAETMKNTLLINNVTQNNGFNNYDAELIQSMKFGRLGLGYHIEKSSFTKQTDSLYAGSYNFNASKVFFESHDTSKINYQVQLTQRNDQLPYLGKLLPSTTAREINWRAAYTSKKGSRLSLNGSFRTLNYLDTLVVKGINEENTLGRIEADLPFFKKAIKLNTFFQIGTGQEQKREFVYLKVSDGNGIYIWKDYDSNKVESINEFELASEFDRKLANYIRTFLPVQGFIKSKNLQFNQTLSLSAPSNWHKKKGLKMILTRFSILLVYRAEKRTTTDNLNLYLNPYFNSIEDSDMLSINTNLRGTLYINRNNSTWSADLNRINFQTKNLLVNGYETRVSDETTLNSRYNISRNYGTVLQLMMGKRSYFSQLLNNRNYEYNFYSAEPQFQFTSNDNNLGAALIGKIYQANADTLYAKNLELGLELRLSKAGKGSFTGEFRVINIDFNGDASSPLGYELMRGLLPGKNLTWNIVYQQRLSSRIQMDLSYDGRKSEQNDIIHIGRVMIRYLF